jgi:cytochrome c2
MEKQYCKVGTVTPMTTGRQAIALLEYQYQSFMEKASNIKYSDSKLKEFFEQKAKKIKKTLEELV